MIRLVSFQIDYERPRLGALRADRSVLDLQRTEDGLPAFASMLSLIEAGPSMWEAATVLVRSATNGFIHDADRYSLLAPLLLPPQIRDFMCFEKHVIQAFGAAFRMRAQRAPTPEDRDAQGAEMPGGLGPAKGKDFDGTNAFGPCIVTADEIPDPHALPMIVRVNGEERSRGSSAEMHWKFEDVIAYASQGETLHPGEILASGTVGNGCGLEHLRFLEDGDEVELEIQPIGTLRNRVVCGTPYNHRAARARPRTDP